MTAPRAVLTSRTNPTFRALAALVADAREVRKARRTVLVGDHLVEACLEAGHPIRRLLLSEAAQATGLAARFRAASPGTPVVEFATSLFRELVAMPSAGTVAAEIDIPAGKPVPAGEDVVALDDVQDPGNVGTILRSAAGAGYRHVVLGRGCANPWSHKVLRAAQGAQFALGLYEVEALDQWLAGCGLAVIGAVAANARSLFELDLRPAHAWVFGSEGAGLSEAVAARVDERATIPLAAGVESLNVGAAAAVCLFEAWRQRRDDTRRR